jgi:hypothetical protein
VSRLRRNAPLHLRIRRLGEGAALLALAACALLVFPALAAAGAGSRQEAKLKFTQKRAGAPSGLKLRIDYVNPDDPEAKPPSVRRVVTVLARGAGYDTGAPDLCAASDVELAVLGTSACSARSVVGAGVITFDTGLPGPSRIITVDTIFLNNTNEQIFVNTVRGAGARVPTRSEVRRRRNTAEAPFLPGALPDGSAVDTVRVDIFPIARTRTGSRRSARSLASAPARSASSTRGASFSSSARRCARPGS